jgi:hypothetical protein
LPKQDEPSQTRLCNVLDMLYMANRTARLIHYKEFYNERINTDKEYRRVSEARHCIEGDQEVVL